jgi:type II secretory pathway pseudopilin PulG
MKTGSKTGQSGVSLLGLIFVIAIIGVVAMLGMKVFPTFTEFMGIKKAIMSAKQAGTTPAEIRTSFNKQAEVGYIDAISGKDLEVTKNGDQFDVSFAYEKKIPLVGPASLLLEYEGTTAVNAPKGAIKKKQAE